MLPFFYFRRHQYFCGATGLPVYFITSIHYIPQITSLTFMGSYAYLHETSKLIRRLTIYSPKLQLSVRKCKPSAKNYEAKCP